MPLIWSLTILSPQSNVVVDVSMFCPESLQDLSLSTKHLRLFAKMQPRLCRVCGLFPVHYQHFLSLAGSLNVIELDGHWSAIDIGWDSKVIIALPRGERHLPGLLSASPSSLPSSELACHRWRSCKTGSIKMRVVLRCVNITAGDACHDQRVLIGWCRKESHPPSLSSIRGTEQFIFTQRNLPGFLHPRQQARCTPIYRKISVKATPPTSSSVAAVDEVHNLSMAIRTLCVNPQ